MSFGAAWPDDTLVRHPDLARRCAFRRIDSLPAKLPEGRPPGFASTVLRPIPRARSMLRTARKLSVTDASATLQPDTAVHKPTLQSRRSRHVGRQSLTFTTPGSTSASPSKKPVISAWDRGTTGADAPW